MLKAEVEWWVPWIPPASAIFRCVGDGAAVACVPQNGMGHCMLAEVTEEVVIIVKAVPQPSKRYGEMVCCAGVTRQGEWRRLYPIRSCRRFCSWGTDHHRSYDAAARKHRGCDLSMPTEGQPDNWQAALATLLWSDWGEHTMRGLLLIASGARGFGFSGLVVSG